MNEDLDKGPEEKRSMSFMASKNPKKLRQRIAIVTSIIICLLLALLAIFKPFGLFKEAEKSTKASSIVGYPKIGIWRPNFGTTSYSDIARGDYVVMPSAADQSQPGSVDDTRIANLRGLNPSIILLDDVNSSELPYDPSGSSAFDATRLGAVDPSWILLQVGSTLSTSVDTVSTTISVGDVTKFRVNDLVVIDREYSLVTAVGTTTLTVKRGWAGSKVATHASGARIAAAVSGWPGTVKLDVSDNCPLVDIGHGPERFRDWAARTQAARLALHKWDGLFVDMTAGEMTFQRGTTSWRTIADRTNPTVEVNYATFDTAWAKGMSTYLTQLRTNVGTLPIIMPNDAVPVYTQVNGAIHESFPKLTDTTQWWTQWVSGKPALPLISSTSYLDWLAKALKPNLATILTYETPSGLGPHPTGWVPNYQKFRFGLTTALMGDGYYSYEISSDRILWFDEYDNAGAGKGYLGQPVSPMALALPPLTTPDLLAGAGTFDSLTKVNAWSLINQNGAISTKTLDTGAVRVDVTKSATDNDVHLRYSNLTVTGGTPYTITFQVKSSLPNDQLSVWLQKTGSPYSLLGTSRYNDMSQDWREVALTVTPNASASDMGLHLVFGAKVGSTWIKDIRIQQGRRADVYRRDYDNGIVLVNPSDTAVTIPLGGNFRKIKGTQAPTVNDGTLVSAVTLQPKDGIVLLRETIITPTPDTTPPVVNITSPTNGASVTGTVPISASATDNVGVVKTEFFVDNVSVGIATGYPYSVNWNTSTASVGTHTLKATAFDAAGNNASSQITVNVTSGTTVTPPPPVTTTDTTPPTATLIRPTASSTVSKTVAIKLSASDASGIQKVEFYIDGKLMSTLTAPNSQGYYQYNWNTGSYANGSHEIKVIAYDNSPAHNQKVISIFVTVSNSLWTKLFH